MPPLVQPVISATGLVMSRSERELQADRVHTRLKKRSGLCSCVTQEVLEAQQIPVTVESFFRDLGQLSLKKKVAAINKHKNAYNGSKGNSIKYYYLRHGLRTVVLVYRHV